ncbi:hypothetical protein ACIRL2_43280 [Embleya sp. NPDC127516]|uniref:hypothetical protein n=1 Tax=Embleya sp. NPDC127516 TaxID=3363990 RepID=UPI00381A24FE
MPLHRLATKIDTWTRWAEHRIHEGPHQLNGSTCAAWREQYPGHACPPLWIVTTGADPSVLRRRIDRVRPALHAMRALDRRVMRVYATTLEQLAEHGPTHRRICTTIV